jgi:hypothetical protein
VSAPGISEADLKLRRNEEFKLTASFLNGLAIACFTAGVFAPLAAAAIGNQPLTVGKQGNRVKGSWSDEACEEFVVPCCGLASRAD